MIVLSPVLGSSVKTVFDIEIRAVFFEDRTEMVATTDLPLFVAMRTLIVPGVTVLTDFGVTTTCPDPFTYTA